MPRPHFQFSIRWILVTTAAVAVWLGLWVAVQKHESPWWLGMLVLAINLVLPPICWIACLSATGHARPFWFGVSFSTTIAAAVFFISLQAHSYEYQLPGIIPRAAVDILHISASLCHLNLAIYLFAPFVGLLCAGSRWFMERDKPPAT